MITGASGGIGWETVKLFRKLGAVVSAQGNTKADTLDHFARDTDDFSVYKVDATSEKDVERFFEMAYYQFGPPDVLVGIFIHDLK